MQEEINNDEKLKVSVKAFLELGGTRNKLVHLNFANYPLEKTAEEIYKMYQEAIFFVRFLKNHFTSAIIKYEKAESANSSVKNG